MTDFESLTNEQLKALEDLIVYCSLDLTMFNEREGGKFPILTISDILEPYYDTDRKEYGVSFFWFSVPDLLCDYNNVVKDLERSIKIVLGDEVAKHFKYEEVEHIFNSEETKNRVETLRTVITKL